MASQASPDGKGASDLSSGLDWQAERAALQDELHALRAQLAAQTADHARWQTILDRMPGAVAYWDAHLRLRYLNPYLARHWAHKDEATQGLGLFRGDSFEFAHGGFLLLG